MSDESDTNYPVVNISSSSGFEDGDEALETLVKLKELDFGDVFTNRNTQLDSDEGEGISITFTHEEEHNVLHLYTDSENNVRIDLWLGRNYIEHAGETLNNVLGVLGQVEPERIIVSLRVDYPFKALGLPIEDDTELQVIGMRIREGRTDYIIQQSRDDDDVTLVTMEREFESESVEEFDEGLGVDDVTAAREFVEALQ